MDRCVAVLIPCFNEAAAIRSVVAAFRAALPEATIYVYDNNSTDETVSEARAAGAVVRSETRQGKGSVVRRMFRDVDADYYLMVDGDGTYDPAVAAGMLALAGEGQFDLVNAVRIETDEAAYRAGHRFGNRMLTGAVRMIFGNRVNDMLSGYKVFSRRFVKSFPIASVGFGIETELTVHALELDMPVAHVSGSYGGRMEGSSSKLNTYRDGLKILFLILQLFKHERPLPFFSVGAAVLALVSIGLGLPVVNEYIHTGLVLRQPTALLAASLMIMAVLSMATGFILDTVTKGRQEMKALAYLAQSATANRARVTGSRIGE